MPEQESPGLDNGRPKQTATMLVHPEKTNLDEFLAIMGDMLNRMRRGDGIRPVSITVSGRLLPITELQQHWNGDVMELHMDVTRYTFAYANETGLDRTESEAKVRAHARASEQDEDGDNT